jgi:hypothetical protein
MAEKLIHPLLLLGYAFIHLPQADVRPEIIVNFLEFVHNDIECLLGDFLVTKQLDPNSRIIDE